MAQFANNPEKGLYKLHIDTRPGTEIRDNSFGHNNSLYTFCEGYLAKYVGQGELHFYQRYNTFLYKYLPKDLVPEVFGVVHIKGMDNQNDKTEVQFDFNPSLDVEFDKNDNNHLPMLLEKDITAGYEKPSIIDLKLGTRTWRIGVSSHKVDKKIEKLHKGLCHDTKFRVRAAMWYSKSTLKEIPHFAIKDGLATVDRDFGNTCSIDELKLLFKDFFKYPETKLKIIEKIQRLKSSLIELREHYGIRFYCSSLLIVYDDKHPDSFDVRILDFEKCYVGVEMECHKYKEPIENTEDEVVDALANIINLIQLS